MKTTALIANMLQSLECKSKPKAIVGKKSNHQKRKEETNYKKGNLGEDQHNIQMLFYGIQRIFVFSTKTNCRKSTTHTYMEMGLLKGLNSTNVSV
jgi:hypothetical protein